jgi:hypothetical protein
MKYRTRFDRNKTRVIRVSIPTYLALKQAAEEGGVPIAEVLDLLLKKEDHVIRIEPAVSRAQIPLIADTKILVARPIIQVDGRRSIARAVKPVIRKEV